MSTLPPTAASFSTIRLDPGVVLIPQGEPGGDLYMLEEGALTVERDGVEIATITSPGALVGEMSVVLGTPTTAAVRVKRASTLRVYANARDVLKSDPELTFRLAHLMACRLDATSALLVEHTRSHGTEPEPDLLSRIMGALHLSIEPNVYVPVSRHDMFGGPDPSRE